MKPFLGSMLFSLIQQIYIHCRMNQNMFTAFILKTRALFLPFSCYIFFINLCVKFYLKSYKYLLRQERVLETVSSTMCGTEHLSNMFCCNLKLALFIFKVHLYYLVRMHIIHVESMFTDVWLSASHHTLLLLSFALCTILCTLCSKFATFLVPIHNSTTSSALLRVVA